MKAMYYFPLMMIIVLMGCSNDVDLGLRPKERMDIE